MFPGLFLLPGYLAAQSSKSYLKEVELVLQKAGKNRAELEKAITYFVQQGDPQKLDAIYFLIANMDIHYSADDYWVDNTGHRIPYHELDYPTYEEAVEAFKLFKQKLGGLHSISIKYKDIDTIKADFLIQNTNLAFAAWRKQAVPCTFEDFCEYVLPYRVSIEPLEDWRNTYTTRFGSLYEYAGTVPPDTLLLRIGQNIKTWFTDTYRVEERKEPLSRLGAMQLLLRKKGACEDIADLASLIARSAGFASSVDMIPAWATASGLHYINYMDVNNFGKHHFDASDNQIIDSLSREPAKVIRTTFSRQQNTAAAIADTSQIPSGYMQLSNYKDVTHEFWVTQDVPVTLFNLGSAMPPLAFASVWNYMEWKPIWWGKVSGSKTVFTNMSKGVVYLPVYYINRQLLPAGWPIAIGYHNTLLLKPDTVHTHTIHITEQPQYLSFRTRKKYSLFYWNNQWIKAGVKTADINLTELVFDKVPTNALLLLVPQYKEDKERPFIITNEGRRVWF
jgi:hypothetical protein